MKIGLVRHFKVDLSYPDKWLLSKVEIDDWFETYTKAGVIFKPVDLSGSDWKRCYVSPMARAVQTAQHIYPGEFIVEEVLKELDAMPLIKSGYKWPFLVWAIFVRRKFSSSDQVVVAFKQKIMDFVEEMLSEHPQDVLIVSHGFVMMCIQKELMKRGFRGKAFRAPVNGRLYIFEK